MTTDNQWRSRIYDNYMTNVFSEAHGRKNEMDLQCKYYKKNYLRYLPSFKEARILELGSGMGHFYNFLLKNGYKNYEGVDLSDENIAYIKENINPEVNVHKVDMIKFLEESEADTFDVVVFNDVIEHLTKPEIFAVMDGVMRVLKQGGVFLIKTLNMANPYVNTAGRYIVIDHEVGFTENSMREVLRACGYADINIVGTDVYVLNPIISIPAKLLSKLINLWLRFLSALYGRTSIKIFEKDILAIAYKK